MATHRKIPGVLKRSPVRMDPSPSTAYSPAEPNPHMSTGAKDALAPTAGRARQTARPEPPASIGRPSLRRIAAILDADAPER